MEVPPGGSWSYGLEQLPPHVYSYHPLVYKTMACPEFGRGVKCERGEYCAKRHISILGVDHDAYYCKKYMPWYPGMRRK
jgi:hypothetical protein